MFRRGNGKGGQTAAADVSRRSPSGQIRSNARRFDAPPYGCFVRPDEKP